MLVLGRRDLEALLEPRAVVEALAAAFAAHAAGTSSVPPRMTVPLGDDAVLLVMPAVAHGAAATALGTKLVTFHPANRARGAPTIQATYVLTDGATGQPLALLEGTYLTGLRTGGASALAARHLARPDARKLVCFGAGVQAAFQLQCLTTELPIERVAVVGRDAARASRFAAAMAARLHLPVEVATDQEAAVSDADVITCATTSTTPLFDGRRLPPGVHVDAVGSFQPTAREVDAETLRRARVVVDHAGALDSAGDIVMAVAEGRVARAHVVGTLTDLVSGAVAGRTRAQEITLFKSVGFALEDLAVARLATARARERGVGQEVTL